MLEGLAVRLATPRITPIFSTSWNGCWIGWSAPARAAPATGLLRHQEFHAAIYGLSGRPKLIRQINQLHVAIEPYMRIWFDYVEKPLSAREEHETLITALRSGDPRHAEIIMQQHIGETPTLLENFASPVRR